MIVIVWMVQVGWRGLGVKVTEIEVIDHLAIKVWDSDGGNKTSRRRALWQCCLTPPDLSIADSQDKGMGLGLSGFR